MWSKTEQRPSNIPKAPQRVYEGKGWNGWGDFLGTGVVASKDGVFLEFDEAKVHQSIGLKTLAEFQEWARTDQRPSNFPSDPQRVYNGKGWNGWGDFLGTGVVASKDKVFLEFDEAKKFHPIDRSQDFLAEFQEWAKTEQRPSNIPKSPHYVYQDKGWNGWGDFLGTDRIAPQYMVFLEFEEAKRHIQSIGITTEIFENGAKLTSGRRIFLQTRQ